MLIKIRNIYSHMTTNRKVITGLLLSSLFYLTAAVSVTYPLITDLKNQIPADPGDPLLNVWTLWWDLKSITEFNIAEYFDANVMFPYKNTLAFSEHLTGESILGLPFYLINQNPVFIYNILYLLSFVVAGIGMFILAYHLTQSLTASFFAGLIYAFIPHRIGQAGHIQTLWSGFFPICILYLYRLIDEARIRHIILLSFFVILQSLMNMYFAVYLAIILPLTAVPYIIHQKKTTDVRLIISLIITALLSLLILLPFFLPYIELREYFGLTREIKTISSLPEIKNLSGINRFSFLYKEYFTKLDINEGSFFLGISVAAAATFGIIFSKVREIYRLTLILIIIFSFLIISGPNPTIVIKDTVFNYGFLYRFLYDYFPAFDGTRVPMRFYIFTVLAVSIFAGSGIALTERIKTGAIRVIIFLLVLSAISLEYYARIPAIKFDIFTSPPEILKKVRSLGDGAVIYFPLRHTYSHIIYAAVTGKPTYTSFTGYIHPLNNILKEIEKNPDGADTLNILSALGIRYIAVTDRILSDRFDRINPEEGKKFSKIYEGNDGVIYSLEYDFGGYFTYRNFSEISYFINKNRYYIYLKTDIGRNGSKIPLRLYFNAEITYRKDGRIIQKEKKKIRVPEIAGVSPVFVTEAEKSQINFDEIEITIFGKNKRDSKTFKKRISI